MTPTSMNAPPVNSMGEGRWPSSSHAYSTAKKTSAMPISEASLAPRRRAAAMPAVYAITAATSDSSSTGTSQLRWRCRSSTSLARAARGTIPIPPAAARKAAPTLNPLHAMTSGGRVSSSLPAAESRK
jgi:hypothetical protein